MVERDVWVQMHLLSLDWTKAEVGVSVGRRAGGDGEAALELGDVLGRLKKRTDNMFKYLDVINK